MYMYAILQEKGTIIMAKKHESLTIEVIHVTSQLKYVHLFLDNTAILSGKKIARFYTISETQAVRNLRRVHNMTLV